MPTTTDRIEKQILLRAPLARVWRSLTEPAEFSAWFGAQLDTPFTPGARVRGPMTGKSSCASSAHASGHPFVLEFVVERVEPKRHFSFRWHPYAIDPKADLSREPSTLVEFHLEEVPEGTRLVVTESGFDALPPERRDLAFRMNEGGWAAQLANVERHVASR